MCKAFGESLRPSGPQLRESRACPVSRTVFYEELDTRKPIPDFPVEELLVCLRQTIFRFSFLKNDLI